MTTRDVRSIRNLYYFHRYIPASIARLYGISNKHVLHIIRENKEDSVTVVADLECMVCGLEESQTYYIDGDEENKKPQNIIMLCEADKRRVQHLQLRKRGLTVTPQF